MRRTPHKELLYRTQRPAESCSDLTPSPGGGEIMASHQIKNNTTHDDFKSLHTFSTADGTTCLCECVSIHAARRVHALASALEGHIQ